MTEPESQNYLSTEEREITDIRRIRSYLQTYPLEIRRLVGPVLDKREIELIFRLGQARKP